MKHKIASMIAALMMLNAVLLITGCNPPQGNNSANNSSSGNTASAEDLKGVWKITEKAPDGAEQYLMHVYFDGSTIYAATNASGTFVKFPASFTYNSDGTIRIGLQNFTPVKNGENIDLQLGGETVMSMTKDSSVSPDTIKNAPKPPLPANMASAEDLKGVWKGLDGAEQYLMHVYFDGFTIYAATNASGTFVKHPIPFTYNSDGTITYTGNELIPVKNGAGIDLQFGGKTVMSMTKDPSVSPDTIKNAPATP